MKVLGTKANLRRVEKNKLEIEYHLSHKSIKNYNLRIKCDGTVYLSVPQSVNANTADDFVRDKFEFIKKHIDNFLSKENGKPTEYSHGDMVNFLGRKYPLKVILAERNQVLFDEECFELYTKDVDSVEIKTKTMEKWYRKELEEVLSKMNSLVLMNFFDFPKLELADVKIRKMTSRWGSCIPSKRKITINLNLIEKDIDAIKYVMFHEYCHFVYPDHSKNFYRLLEQKLPRWREMKNKLLES